MKMPNILDRRPASRTRKPSSDAAPLVNALLRPGSGDGRIALADGGETLAPPSAAAVSAEQVAATVADATSAETLLALEKDLMRRREEVEALRAAAEGAKDAEAFQAALDSRARKAERLHAAHMRAALARTLPTEKAAKEHCSLFAAARIPPSDAELLASIRLLPLDARGLMAHPKFGTAELFGPIAGYGNIHEDVFGLIVLCGEVRLNDQVVALGRVAVDHTAMLYVSVPSASLANVDQLRKNQDGEENVVLTCAPIRTRRASVYEDEDVVISGVFGLAGEEIYKMAVSAEHGLGASVTGNNEDWTISDGYAVYDDRGPLVMDFGKGAYGEMPDGVIVAASATNPFTETTSNFNFYGDHTRARHPIYQIPTRFALNHLQRKLTIQGHRLLVPTNRDAALRQIQKELCGELVGPAPKPFTSLKLVVDSTSPAGLAALARGGVRVSAEVNNNSKTEFVSFVIIARQGEQPPPADGSN